MRSLQNRVLLLERSFLPPQVDTCVDDKTLAEASRLLSDQDLETLIDASEGEAQGREPSSRHLAAQRAFARAIGQVQCK